MNDTPRAIYRRDAAKTDVLGFTARVRAVAKDARTIDVVASTDAEDRYGEVVEQVWQLDAYAANPVVLYAHECDELPIGKAENVRVESGQLLATLRFVSGDVNPKAEQVWQLIQEGVLRAVSVGFIPHTYRWEKQADREVLVLTDNELVEISVVPVPANPEALARMRARALAARPPAPDAPPGLAESVAELTGSADPAAQLGRLRAWRDAAAQVEPLQARVTELEAAERRLLEEKAARAEAEEREGLIRAGLASRKLTPAQCRAAEGAAKAGWARTTPLAELKSYLADAVPVVPAAGQNREAPPAPVKTGVAALAAKRWDELTPIEKDRLFREAPETYEALKAAHNDAQKRA
ncbi:MAG: HK97 family phage prohead protease [Polyangiales bacterium]